VIYPTLTFLEEAGYAVSAAEGAKKVFSITEAGSAHLAENRDMVERALEQLERFGRKMAKAREWFGWDDEAQERRGGRRDDELRSVRRRLRAALADILDGPEERRAQAADILKTAAEALEALNRD
jgi:DNA-binding PadR family transcriptional regulator